MRDDDRLGLFVGPEQRRERLGEIGERLVAFSVLRASVEQETDGSLGVPAESSTDRPIGGGDAVERERADVAFVAAQVDETDARSVRAAVEIYRAVSERRADIVEVVRGVLRRVLAQIGVLLERFTTRGQAGHRLLRRCRECFIGSMGAVERPRLACSALIDEHDVVLDVQECEGCGYRRIRCQRSLTRSTREEEQRVGGRVSPCRFHDGNREIERPSRLCRAILEDADRSAFGRDDVRAFARKMARRERERARGLVCRLALAGS